MTRDEFQKAASEAGFRSGAFDLDGQGDECYVLRGNTNHWAVYYSERGLESQVRHFASEAKALEHLLHLLQNDPSARI